MFMWSSQSPPRRTERGCKHQQVLRRSDVAGAGATRRHVRLSLVVVLHVVVLPCYTSRSVAVLLQHPDF